MTKYITQILPWRDQEGVECFDFNEIKEDPFTQTARVLRAVGVKSNFTDHQIWNVVDSSINKPTQTLSKTTDRSKYWSGISHQMIEDLMKKYEVVYP